MRRDPAQSSAGSGGRGSVGSVSGDVVEVWFAVWVRMDGVCRPDGGGLLRGVVGGSLGTVGSGF